MSIFRVLRLHDRVTLGFMEVTHEQIARVAFALKLGPHAPTKMPELAAPASSEEAGPCSSRERVQLPSSAPPPTT
jgi:hypothetical protein